jgi:hypothetical protein
MPLIARKKTTPENMIPMNIKKNCNFRNFSTRKKLIACGADPLALGIDE